MYQIPLIIRKNNGLLNLSVDRIYSIDAFSLALLKEFSQFGLPNKRVLTILSSFSVKIFSSIVAIFVKEGLYLNIKICAMEKEMNCCFNTITTATHWIYRVLKVMFKFMFF